jgi:flagellar hook-basal body complex protein FliE
MSSIQGISVTPPAIPRPPSPSVGATSDAAGSFQTFLANSIQEVNTAQLQADQAVEALFTGGEVNPAEVLSAVKKADLAFRMLMQIRNKLVAAYDEVKNIRV